MKKILLISIIFSLNTISCAKKRSDQGNRNVWHSDSTGILIEISRGFAPPTEATTPSYYFSLDDLNEEQIGTLESWTKYYADEFPCYKVEDAGGHIITIFNEDTENSQRYFSTSLTCDKADLETQYIQKDDINNFDLSYTYDPDSESTDILIENVEVDSEYLTISYSHSYGCGTYSTANLVLDNQIDSSERQAYLLYRSDNNCEALGRSELIIDIQTQSYTGISTLKIKGWDETIDLP